MTLSDRELQSRTGVEDDHGIEDGFRLRFLFRLAVLLTILLAISLLVRILLVRVLLVLFGFNGFVDGEEAELQQGGSVEIDLGLVFLVLGLFVLLFLVQFHHGHGNEVVVQVRLVVALLDEILEIALRERGHEVRHIFLHTLREIGIETGDQGEDLVVPHVGGAEGNRAFRDLVHPVDPFIVDRDRRGDRVLGQRETSGGHISLAAVVDLILEIDHIDQRRGKLILDFGQCLLRRQLIDDILQRIVQPADGIQDLAQDLTHRLTDQPEQIGLDLPDERVEDLVHDPVPDIGRHILGQFLDVVDSVFVQVVLGCIEDGIHALDETVEIQVRTR